MLTLKTIHSNGDEAVYEATSFKHCAKRNVVDFVNSSGELCPIRITPQDVVYAMNSSGSTVGRYTYLQDVTI